METELGYYSQVALLVLPLLKSPDIIQILIQYLKQAETEDARIFHEGRMCHGIGCISNYQFNYQFKYWMKFNHKQFYVIDDIKMLTDKHFWQLHISDRVNLRLERIYVSGYSYKHPRQIQRTQSPGRLHKLDLLKGDYAIIKNIWYKNQQNPGNIFKVKFTIDYWDDPVTDITNEVWTLTHFYP